MIGQSCGHRWRDPERLVNPAKIVVEKVNRNHCGVILDFLAKRIGWPSKAAHSNSN